MNVPVTAFGITDVNPATQDLQLIE